MAENGTSVSVSITSTGPAVVAIESFGGSAIAGADFALPPYLQFLGAGTLSISILLVNDNLGEGDEIANLVLIPLSGCRLLSVATASATVTITDDDDDDSKKCGFGTGLTVFFLFGFGLMLRQRLRRR